MQYLDYKRDPPGFEQLRRWTTAEVMFGEDVSADCIAGGAHDGGLLRRARAAVAPRAVLHHREPPARRAARINPVDALRAE